jgi:hypothetical protein
LIRSFEPLIAADPACKSLHAAAFVASLSLLLLIKTEAKVGIDSLKPLCMSEQHLDYATQKYPDVPWNGSTWKRAVCWACSCQKYQTQRAARTILQNGTS